MFVNLCFNFEFYISEIFSLNIYFMKVHNNIFKRGKYTMKKDQSES